MSSQAPLTSCHCCGLIQQLPTTDTPMRYQCARCGTSLDHRAPARQYWTISLSAGALTFYLPAMLLPMMRIEQLGHVHESSLIAGVFSLLEHGNIMVGVVVFLFSIILPPLKLLALLALCMDQFVPQHRHKALIYHAVELLGRWGMLDVMLVAVLVAFVKVGDLVSIHISSGLIAFMIMVLLSLVASMTFNPQQLWHAAREP